jgi:hypothetical protein
MAGHHVVIASALAVREGTIHEIAARLCWASLERREIPQLTHVQVARRLPELQAKGIAVPTGRTKAEPGGLPCRIWRLKRRPSWISAKAWKQRISYRGRAGAGH